MHRRLIALFLIALVAVVAGCGGGDDGGSSLDDQLGYLPKDAPLVAVIETDLQSEQYRNLDKLLAKFPFAGQLKNQLKQSIATSGVDYDKDLKPLLGEPLVVGAPDAKSIVDSGSEDAYVVVWNVKDGDKFRELIKKEGDSRESGEVGGETAYESEDGSVVVVKGDTLVGANDRPTLEAALERAGGDDTLTEEQFDGAFGDLPEESLARVYGDLQKLLEADPTTATARSVKWVSGLRTFGATATAEGDGLAFDLRVNTEGIGDADLPLAAGDESPPVARLGELGAALRNPSQLIAFVQNTARAVDPTGFQEFEAEKAAAGQQLGIDIDQDVFGQFTGATSISAALDNRWAIRSEVRDPAAMRETLAAMVDKGEAGGLQFADADGLVVATEDDNPQFYFGMVGDTFVASPQADTAKEIATAQTQPVPDAKGSLVGIADGEAIAKAALESMGGQGALGGQFFTGPIGDLTAWVASSPQGMRVRVKLAVQ